MQVQTNILLDRNRLGVQEFEDKKGIEKKLYIKGSEGGGETERGRESTSVSLRT